MRQQCGADASGAPSSCEPGAPRSQALVLELPRLSRGQAQRAEPVRSAWLALAQLRLVATPPNDSRRFKTKILNSRSWGLRRSPILSVSNHIPDGRNSLLRGKLYFALRGKADCDPSGASSFRSGNAL